MTIADFLRESAKRIARIARTGYLLAGAKILRSLPNLRIIVYTEVNYTIYELVF